MFPERNLMVFESGEIPVFLRANASISTANNTPGLVFWGFVSSVTGKV